VELDDPTRWRADADAAAGQGFTAKLCIHPRQVSDVNAAFASRPDEVAWAQRILAAVEAGATRVDGQMVDAPVRVRAQALLARARIVR
jgi:citrate lyase subunit beta/citryl-CoA lyase